MADRSLLVKLRAEVSQFVAGMKQSSKAADEVAKSAEAIGPKSDKASTALGKLEAHAQKNAKAYRVAGGALLAFGAGTVALGAAALKTGIAYNTLQQTSRAALTTLLGSAKAANVQMDALDDFARNSPFSKEVFIKAQQQLLGFGVAAKDVVPALDAVQNAVAAFGGSSEDISPVVDVLARVQSQGRLSGDALERLGYYGVDAASIIGEQMGLTGAQIKDMASKPGGIPVEQVWDPLVNGLQEKFGGAADNVKNTFAGSIDRVRAAWRDFSGELAAPIVNPRGGGFGIDVLNGLADMMRGFQDLPGPVKTAITVLTGATGATALAAGGFLLLAPRIAETRAALATMGPGTQAAIGGLGKLGKVAGALIITLAALKVASEIGPQSESVAKTTKFSSALLDVAEGGKSASRQLERLAQIEGARPLFTQSSSSVHGLADAIDALDMNGLEKGVISVTSVFGLFDTKASNSAKVVGEVDTALTGLVTSGSLEEAATGFEYFAAQAAKSGLSTSEAKKMLPGYTEALAAADNQQRQAGDSAGKLGSDLANMSPEAQAAAEAMAQMKQATAESAMSFLDFSADIDATNFSIDKWIRGLEEMAAAQANWADNMIKATARGVDEGVIAKFQEMGPAGAKALEELVSGSQKNIDRLNAVFAQGVEGAYRLTETLHGVPPEVLTRFAALGINPSVDAVMALQRKYNLTPEQVSTIMTALDIASPKIQKVLYRMAGLNRTSASPKISVATAQAYAAIAGVQRRIKNMKGRTIGIHIQSTYGGGTTTADADGSIRRYFADGGIAGGEDHRAAIYKPTPKNAVRFFAEEETGGEAYIPLASAKRQRSLAIWEETGRLLGAKVFADGAIARYAPIAQRFSNADAAGATVTNVFNYYAADGPSFSSEKQLFKALSRARAVFAWQS